MMQSVHRSLPLIRILAALAGVTVSACAVGPNYKQPAPPHASSYAPEGAMPDSTAAVPLPGGDAQRFVNGLDIPGQWWTLFQSPELNALIERGIANSPNLEAAQAALRQANEAAAAQRGSYLPSVSGNYQVERQKASGAQFGLPTAGSFLYTLNSASVNVAYTIDAFGGVRRQVEAMQAQADYQRFALEASYLSLTANIVTAAVTEASLRAQLAATQDIARSQRAQLKSPSGASLRAARHGRTSFNKSRRYKALWPTCRSCAVSSHSSAISSQPMWVPYPPTMAAQRSTWTRSHCPSTYR